MPIQPQYCIQRHHESLKKHQYGKPDDVTYPKARGRQRRSHQGQSNPSIASSGIMKASRIISGRIETTLSLQIPGEGRYRATKGSPTPVWHPAASRQPQEAAVDKSRQRNVFKYRGKPLRSHQVQSNTRIASSGIVKASRSINRRIQTTRRLRKPWEGSDGASKGNPTPL